MSLSVFFSFFVSLFCLLGCRNFSAYNRCGWVTYVIFFVIAYTYLSVDSTVVLVICNSGKFVYHSCPLCLVCVFFSLCLCVLSESVSSVFVSFCSCVYLCLSVSLCKFFCRPSGLLHEVILIRAMVPACSWYYFSVLNNALHTNGSIPCLLSKTDIEQGLDPFVLCRALRTSYISCRSVALQQVMTII